MSSSVLAKLGVSPSAVCSSLCGREYWQERGWECRNVTLQELWRSFSHLPSSASFSKHFLVCVSVAHIPPGATVSVAPGWGNLDGAGCQSIQLTLNSVDTECAFLQVPPSSLVQERKSMAQLMNAIACPQHLNWPGLRHPWGGWKRLDEPNRFYKLRQIWPKLTGKKEPLKDTPVEKGLKSLSAQL